MPPGRRLARRLQLRLNRVEARGGHRLALDHRQHARQQAELVRGRIRRPDDAFDPALPRQRERDREQARQGEPGRAPPGHKRRAERDQVRGGQQRRDRTRPGCGQDRRRAAPGAELGRVEPGGHFLADQRQALPQVQARRQLGNGALAGPDLVRRRGSEQPVRQRPLAGAKPGRGDQLEEGTPPEQIQVGRVQVFRRRQGQPVGADARPAVLEAGQAPLVERRGPADAVSSRQDPLVQDRQDDEDRGRQGQPGEPDQVRGQGRPCNDGEQAYRDQAEVRQPIVPARQRVQLGPPRLEPYPILVHHHPSLVGTVPDWARIGDCPHGKDVFRFGTLATRLGGGAQVC